MSSERSSSPKSAMDVLRESEVPPEERGGGKCSRCGCTENDDGSPVTWRCAWCENLVCRRCTLTYASGLPAPYDKTYYHDTLCSDQCWWYIGRPEE